jgi:chlorobactene glucosyltransferase
MPAAFGELWAAVRPIITPLLVYQISVSVFVLFALINAIADWFTFRRPTRAFGVPAALPSLSVLIPARNEEATLAPCVRSLLAQEYPGRLEVLVLDDHSDDATGRVAQELAQNDDRVRVLNGGPLLPGWKGKPNALRQLAEAATGDMLLLTDADCVFYPGAALASAVQHRERVGADCLSLMPYLECGSFWEHVVVPLQYFLVFATLPVRNVYASRNPAFAAANGAFLLLPRATYEELGGHEAVGAKWPKTSSSPST